MAPKSRRSIRKKKQCWDLVVSTPEQSKGQQRKAVEDLGKGKKKKGESSSNVNQERDPLYFLEDKDLEREVQKGKIPLEDDESKEEQEEENEDAKRNKRDGDNEEEAGQKEKEDSNHKNRDDCSETESDASPILIRRKSQKLGRLSKFSNIATMALELSPLPSLSPSTPIHAPHASTSHTTSPPPHL
ncbi:hypothetical protein Acr_05g0009460 [Actinidia rufa]|uniref:Uncharacterized protein n=1 Tax=Actinidia rufa TaxID=165716 RepID=A0A7J0EP15_9ERIC|nr:hypothetical protein Acr_05g0009460 [Actinidia rufa]